MEVIHGFFPVASSLNRRISPASPLLRATLDVRWDEPDALAAVASLERSLSALSPTFVLHECRGPHAYHVFSGDASRRPAGFGSRRDARRSPPAFDGCLALAHLIEHAVIDFQCHVSDGSRCSGLTGAYRGSPARFDLMIECWDFALGRCCLALAVIWVTQAAAGHPLGEEERAILGAARLAYRGCGRSLTPPELSSRLGIDPVRSRRALETLREIGFLAVSRATMNFSGIPEYRIASPRPVPFLPCRDYSEKI